MYSSEKTGHSLDNNGNWKACFLLNIDSMAVKVLKDTSKIKHYYELVQTINGSP